eukprot:257414_1
MGNCMSSHNDKVVADQIQRRRSMTVIASPSYSPVDEGLPENLYKMMLQVTVHQGVGLAVKDVSLIGGKSDPYVKLRMSSKGESYRTTYQSSTLNPSWDEELLVDVDLSENVRIKNDLVATVMDHDSLRFDDPMGTVRIPCRHLNHGESEMKWYQLDNAAGKIRLTLEMKRVLCEDDSVAGYLRDKMLDAVEIILKLMETWGVRAGLSVSFTLGIFRFSVSASIDGLKTTVTKVEDLSEVNEIAGEKTRMNATDIEEQKKSTLFEETIEEGVAQLKESIAMTRAAFLARGLSGSMSSGVHLKFYGIGMSISVSVSGSRKGVAIEEQEHLFGLRMVEEQALDEQKDSEQDGDEQDDNVQNADELAVNSNARRSISRYGS